MEWMLALARALLLADAVSHDALGEALQTAAREGSSLVHVLLESGAMERERLQAILLRDHPPFTAPIAAAPSLVVALPSGLCEKLLALPIGRDPSTGTVDVAVVDWRDGHPVAEIAYWLGAPARPLLTSLAAMHAALGALQSPAEGAGARSPLDGGSLKGWPSPASGPPTPRWAPSQVAEASLPNGERDVPASERAAEDPRSSGAPTVRGPFASDAFERDALPTVRGPFKHGH